MITHLCIKDRHIYKSKHHASTYMYQYMLGDFHFMWECVRIILSWYWGNASTPGSLYHLREIVRHHKVDQKGKVFSIADEFIHNCFHSHLLANNIYASSCISLLHLTLYHMRILKSGSVQQLNSFSRGV